jgi:hypothetical protein
MSALNEQRPKIWIALLRDVESKLTASRVAACRLTSAAISRKSAEFTIATDLLGPIRLTSALSNILRSRRKQRSSTTRQCWPLHHSLLRRPIPVALVLFSLPSARHLEQTAYRAATVAQFMVNMSTCMACWHWFVFPSFSARSVSLDVHPSRRAVQGFLPLTRCTPRALAATSSEGAAPYRS